VGAGKCVVSSKSADSLVAQHSSAFTNQISRSGREPLSGCRPPCLRPIVVRVQK